MWIDWQDAEQPADYNISVRFFSTGKSNLYWIPLSKYGPAKTVKLYAIFILWLSLAIEFNMFTKRYQFLSTFLMEKFVDKI